MPPRNRFHDLVDAAGVASRILWLCVLVVGLRWHFCAPPPPKFRMRCLKKFDFKLTDLFQRIILGLHQISWVYTSKQIHHTDALLLEQQELLKKTTTHKWSRNPPNERFNREKTWWIIRKTYWNLQLFNLNFFKKLRFFASLFHPLTQFYFRKLLDAPKCLLPAENPQFFQQSFVQLVPGRVNFSTLEKAPCVTRLAGPVSPASGLGENRCPNRNCPNGSWW